MQKQVFVKIFKKYIFKNKIPLLGKICITHEHENDFSVLNSAVKKILNRICYFAIGIILFVSMTNLTSLNPDEIPVSIKVPIFLKVLSFDRQLHKRSGSNLNMLIVFQSRYRQSQTERDDTEDVLDNLSINSIEGMAINYYYMDIDEVNIQDEISKHNINLIFVCPLRGISLETITSLCREKKILSFADVSSYVENKLSVGIEMKGEKPQIIINLKNSKAEGADFSSQLLKLSRVIE